MYIQQLMEYIDTLCQESKMKAIRKSPEFLKWLRSIGYSHVESEWMNICAEWSNDSELFKERVWHCVPAANKRGYSIRLKSKAKSKGKEETSSSDDEKGDDDEDGNRNSRAPPPPITSPSDPASTTLSLPTTAVNGPPTGPLSMSLHDGTESNSILSVDPTSPTTVPVSNSNVNSNSNVAASNIINEEVKE